MKKLLPLLTGALLVCASLANASPFGPSVAINFGADEPPGVGSDVEGAAGVLETEIWNNFSGNNSSGPQTLLQDNLGTPEDSGAVVEWASPNTWASTGRGEENNTAPAGPDRNLMTGYLDNTDTIPLTISVLGLSPEYEIADVYLYITGGVPQRGGDYTVNGETKANLVTGPFTGDFVEGATGNYLLFENVDASALSISALGTNPSTPRAPINGIEIVGKNVIPEPSSIVLLVLGAVGLLAGRYGRRAV